MFVTKITNIVLYSHVFVCLQELACLKPSGEKRVITIKEEDYKSFSNMHYSPDGKYAYLVAGGPQTFPKLIKVDVNSGKSSIIRESHSSTIDREYFSVPQERSWDTRDGAKAHGYYYPPQVGLHIFGGAGMALVSRGLSLLLVCVLASNCFLWVPRYSSLHKFQFDLESVVEEPPCGWPLPIESNLIVFILIYFCLFELEDTILDKMFGTPFLEIKNKHSSNIAFLVDVVVNLPFANLGTLANQQASR